MIETNLQLGGGYIYQWECAVLLALDCFFEVEPHNPELSGLIAEFLGQVESMHLEGEERESGADLEDINLVSAQRRILIQVKAKQSEAARWTPTDPMLLKSLSRFYQCSLLDEQPEDVRFVFLTNRPFNSALVKVKKAVQKGTVDQCEEADTLLEYLKQLQGVPLDVGRFRAMLLRTTLVQYADLHTIKSSVLTKLQDYGPSGRDQAHDQLLSHFAEHSTRVGGGAVTCASLVSLLGSPPEAGPSLTPLGPRPECPYLGMRPFTEKDKDHFFGRSREIESLVRSLRRHPFLAIIGLSGSGKSSLAAAGLVPELRKSTLFGPGNWLILHLRPQSAPLTNLIEALGGEPTDPAWELSRLLATQPGARRLLLVVDQFEEVFSQASREEVTPFQQALLELAETKDCYVVLTIRADFYPQLMDSPLWPEIRAHRMELPHLDEAGLRLAIAKPSEQIGVFVEKALIERLVAEAAGDSSILPFMQETLVLLWDRMERNILSLRTYDDLVSSFGAGRGPQAAKQSGLHVAIAEHADEALANLSPEQEAIARRILLRLIQFGDGQPDTRRQQLVADLRASGDDLGLFTDTLNHLATWRLVTLSGEEDHATSKADLAHDALIRGWPTLQGWLSKDRAFGLWRQKLDAAVRAWREADDDEDALLRGAPLSEAEEWLAERYDDLNEAERAFIEEGVALRARQAARLRWFAGLVAALAVVAVIVVVVAIRQWKLATHAEHLVRARELDSAATSILEVQPLLALRLTLEGMRLVPDGETEAENLLLDHARQIAGQARLLNLGADVSIAGSPDSSRFILRRDGSLYELRHMADGRVLASFGSDITNLAFSPDRGSTYLIISRFDEAKEIKELYSLADGTPLPLTGDAVDLYFSPDGRFFVIDYAGGIPGEVRWSKDGTIQASLPHPVSEVHFSPAQQAIAIEVARVRGGCGELRPLGDQDLAAAPAGEVLGVGPSPGAAPSVLIGYEGAPAEIRHVLNDSPAITLRDAIGSRVAFSPDGTYLFATYVHTTTGDLLSTADGRRLAALKEAESVQFGSDETYLLATYVHTTTSDLLTTADGSRVASFEDLEEENILSGNPLFATFVNPTTGEPVREAVYFSPDLSRLVVVHQDATCELRSTSTGEMLRTFPEPSDSPGKCRLVLFSPNQNVTTFCVDYSLRSCELRSLANGDLVYFQPGGLKYFWSPDMRHLVFVSEHVSAELVDTSTGHGVELTGIVGGDGQVEFSPDGRYFVISYTDDGADRLPAELRRTDDGKRLVTFPGAEAKAYFPTIPNPEYVVIGYEGGGGLWHLPDGDLISMLSGRPVNVQFDPDGSAFLVDYGEWIEVWAGTGTPHFLTKLDLEEGNWHLWDAQGQRLIISDAVERAYLVDLGWLEAMGGDSSTLSAEELERLACAGPLSLGLVDDQDLKSYLDGLEPQACR